MIWTDISVPIRPSMALFEGDAPLRIERTAAIAEGGICNLSRLDFGVHSGTHIDAPVHFIEGAGGIEMVPPEALPGEALVVDATALSSHVDAAAIESLALPPGTERVLFKTRKSALWDLDAFSRGFIAVSEDGACALLRRRVRLVGIDYLSIAPFEDPGPTHITLLGAGCVVLEGLDLCRVTPGRYELTCLPLLIPGSDGAPVRAALRPLQELETDLSV